MTPRSRHKSRPAPALAHIPNTRLVCACHKHAVNVTASSAPLPEAPKLVGSPSTRCHSLCSPMLAAPTRGVQAPQHASMPRSTLSMTGSVRCARPAALPLRGAGLCSVAVPCSRPLSVRALPGTTCVPALQLLCSAAAGRAGSARHVAKAAAAATLPGDDSHGSAGSGEPNPMALPGASPYDKEIASLALPALCTMLLDPIMGAINTGEG